ncbi:hypothetical protein GCM10010515_76380 [Streptomyces fructofermentans]|uniref:Uncharacterized protein n=1 Tax=Streptomyces fructofermentans TaxID=152141 RepID=A0A918NV98_9ACTN|nr:hypothetical protein GCM10010515_76380 [Streptomyces fructofermentans]
MQEATYRYWASRGGLRTHPRGKLVDPDQSFDLGVSAFVITALSLAATLRQLAAQLRTGREPGSAVGDSKQPPMCTGPPGRPDPSTPASAGPVP